MLEHLFREGGDDPFGRAADERSGAWAALVGIAANASIACGGEVGMSDLAGDIPRPDTPLAPFGPGPRLGGFRPVRLSLPRRRDCARARRRVRGWMALEGFDELIAAAERERFEGWDFSRLAGRLVEAPPAFDYLGAVGGRRAGVERMLDLGTGGGEVLSKLAPFPATTIATEAWPPNAVLAMRRLTPLGASVVLVEGAPENWETIEAPLRAWPALPFADGAFDLVIDRHEFLPAG